MAADLAQGNPAGFFEGPGGFLAGNIAGFSQALNRHDNG